MSASTFELPKVTGRHKNRPLAAMRRRKAFELIAGGMSYRQVAAELGYSSPGTVHHIVMKARDEYAVEDVEFRLAIEVQRLNRLQVALWPKAMEGDIAAVRALRNLIMLRIKVLKLDERDAPVRPRTVVDPDNPCNEDRQRARAPDSTSFIKGSGLQA